MLALKFSMNREHLELVEIQRAVDDNEPGGLGHEGANLFDVRAKLLDALFVVFRLQEVRRTLPDDIEGARMDRVLSRSVWPADGLMSWA
jgi:hypothetical protein